MGIPWTVSSNSGTASSNNQTNNSSSSASTPTLQARSSDNSGE